MNLDHLKKLTDKLEEHEKANLANENKYRIMAEQSPYAQFMTDPSGSLVYVNPMFETLFGKVEHNKAFKKTWISILSNKEEASACGMLWPQIVIARKPFNQELECNTNSGQVVVCDISALPDPNDNRYVGYICPKKWIKK